MSASTRLAYDDARTPHEMYDDCRAAGDNLQPTAVRQPTVRVAGVPGPATYDVSERTAQLAAALHLHLD